MRVDIDPTEIKNMLAVWRRTADLDGAAPGVVNIRMLKDRRLTLTHQQRSAVAMALFLHMMTPVDSESEYADLKAHIDDFKQWSTAELAKLCNLE